MWMSGLLKPWDIAAGGAPYSFAGSIGIRRVLARMRRNYTRGEFVRKVDLLRRHISGLAVTTDFIVGFRGKRMKIFKPRCGWAGGGFGRGVHV
jgi:hypothetical protein